MPKMNCRRRSTKAPTPIHWATAGQHAKRRAAEVAVAIDGLADRAANDLGTTPENVRNAVAPYCTIGSVARPGSIERVCAVANAYKHGGVMRMGVYQQKVAAAQGLLRSTNG